MGLPKLDFSLLVIGILTTMNENNKKIESIYDFAGIIVAALISVCVIFTFFFKISTVVGQSMENTLKGGDSVIISSINKEFNYGDVVVVSQPNGYEKVLIKRVIAVGGQTVYFDKINGKVLVDGQELDEPYIKEKMRFSYGMTTTYTVPEGMLFVMGDNRNYSADSRDARIGMIDERYVVGKVFYKMGDLNLFNSDLEVKENV